MTCPVCGQPMSELNRDGAPRTTCADPECTAAWARRHVDPDCLSRRRRDRVQDVADLLAAGESPFQIARRPTLPPCTRDDHPSDPHFHYGYGGAHWSRDVHVWVHLQLLGVALPRRVDVPVWEVDKGWES